MKHWSFVLKIFLMSLSLSIQAENKSNDENFSQGKQIAQIGAVLSHRDRVEPMNRTLKSRLDTLLPKLMDEQDIDMWLVINREYEEDALFFSLVPQPTYAARRTTILVFTRNKKDNSLEKITISRYPIKGFYESKWEGGTMEHQWQRLAEVIAERDPKTIGINYSKNWPLSDGLTHGLFKLLDQYVAPKYKERFTSAENLVIRWMETRVKSEIDTYPHIVTLARGVIAEAFSNKVITPGVTTTDDVAWYIRERFEELQLKPWFQPYVNIQRKGDNNKKDSPYFGRSEIIIEPGDVLHTDVGICYLRLCTDTQEMGYVLKLGEQDVPKGLQAALAKGNRWQDLLTQEFKTGRTGNEILLANQNASQKEGLVISTYTHPIGFVGHSIGPTIGMWDNQQGTPIRGDWKLYPNTAYAIEGNIKAQVSEWNDEWVQIKLEQSALFDGEDVLYLAGRQTEWHIVR